MPEKKEYVKLWLSYRAYFDQYSAEQVGNIIFAMLDYKESGIEPKFDGYERFIWPAIRRDIDEANEAQEKQAAANQANGKKGGRPKKATGFEETEGNRENPFGFEKTEETEEVFEKPKKAMDKGQGQGQGQGTKDSIGRSAHTRFSPPTLAEVQAYVSERHSPVDAQEFIDFYASKGWMVGKTPMKDWKAACRNAEKWERWSKNTPSPPPREKSFSEIAAEMAAEMGARK